MSRENERLAEICRRLLYVARELHAMGYEQLRNVVALRDSLVKVSTRKDTEQKKVA
jgi:hypothetical protein